MTRRGQTTAEYAIFAVVLMAALAGMAVYVKRGISGKLRETANSIGEQYGPATTTSNMTTKVTATSTTTSRLQKDQDVDGDSKVDGNVVITTTKLDAPEITDRSGYETIDP